MNNNIQEIIGKPWFIPAAVGVTASVGGFFAGLAVGMRLGYQARYNEEVEYEDEVVEIEEEQLEFTFDATVEGIQEAIEPEYRVVLEEPTPRNDPNPRNDPRDIVVEIQGVDVDTGLPPVGSVSTNVFDHDDDWDYTMEVASRNGNNTYVIHRDEFWGEEMEYEQTTLTYYAGDDIMVDQDDGLIYSYRLVTGDLLFGHGSGDPNVVFIRNNERQAEYEVVRVDESYSEQILGIVAEEDLESPDLKHSVRKFRSRDD